MDEDSKDDSRDMQESLLEVKRELAYKRLRLLQEEIKELKTQIQTYKGRTYNLLCISTYNIHN